MGITYDLRRQDDYPRKQSTSASVDHEPSGPPIVHIGSVSETYKFPAAIDYLDSGEVIVIFLLKLLFLCRAQ